VASKVASSTKVEIADTTTFHSSGDLVLATNTKPILFCGCHFRILNIAVLKTIIQLWLVCLGCDQLFKKGKGIHATMIR